MRTSSVFSWLILGVWTVRGQDSTDPGVLTFTGTVSSLSGAAASSAIVVGGDVPTRSLTYISATSTRTLSSSSDSASNGTETVSTASSTTQTLTLIGGGSSPTSNGTASATSSSAQATNTQPCNNYPEFCTRKYSNITEVCAHNSPFVRKGNAASNQQLDVTYQLNDGIRMLQGQTHYENNTLWFCHTTCDLLNVGTVEDYLKTVYDWVSVHPYDVVTILLGNYDYVNVNNFTAPIQNSGLGRYAYEPPKVPMSLDDWPTLSEMILTQKRVVFFMDYQANQTEVPYILDEFSQMWETPFSPTNTSFPCTVQRPPSGTVHDKPRDYLYMVNHNLNVEVSLGSFDLLIPNTATLNETNNVTGSDSLGAMAKECTSDWNRPPNFLLVDYYNIPNGTVFEVAAEMNNVTYTGRCCGTSGQTGAATSLSDPFGIFALGLFSISIMFALL